MLCVLVGVWVAALVYLPDAQKDGDGAPAPVSILARSLRQGLGLTPKPARLETLETPLAVPVAGIPREAIRDSWGDPRDNGLRLHHGTDIMAPLATPVVAAAPGVVEKLWISAAGGTTVYVRSPQRKWIYYYAHLSGYAPGLHEGQPLRTGDPVGYVGDTGNAGAGNYHLHFGLTHTRPDEHWYQGQDVNPFPYLAGPSLAGPSLAGKPAPR